MTAHGHGGATAHNPKYEALQKLLTDLKRAEPEFNRCLDRAAKDMAGDKVWTGKTARKWGDEVNGRHRSVKSSVQQLIQTVEDELSRTDKMVTPAEAKKISQQMGDA